MAAYNKGSHHHPATRPLTYLVDNATKHHTRTFGPFRDVQLLVVVVGTAGTGKSCPINVIRQLFTHRAASK